jgi:hypothetical protein
MIVDNNNRFSCCNIFNGCFDVVEAYLCLVGHGIFCLFAWWCMKSGCWGLLGSER